MAEELHHGLLPAVSIVPARGIGHLLRTLLLGLLLLEILVFLHDFPSFQRLQIGTCTLIYDMNPVIRTARNRGCLLIFVNGWHCGHHFLPFQ